MLDDDVGLLALPAHVEYWTEQLRDMPPLLGLPTDHPRRAERGERAAAVELLVPVPVVIALERLAEAHGATLFVTLLAAFEVLLSRYSGQDDVAVGSPVSLPGPSGNIVVLRGDLSDDPTFAQFLAQMKDVASGASAHRDLPFRQMVDIASDGRNLSLIQHLFALHDGTAVPAAAVAELTSSRFDLTVDLTVCDRSVTGVFDYDPDLFDHATVTRMASHFLRLLDEIVAKPDRPVSQLELLDIAEQELQLVAFNDTVSEFPDLAVHQLFERHAARRPEAAAVRDAHGSLTYRQLNEAANRIAHHLRGLGVGSETLVGICLPRSSAMVTAILAVLKAGGAYVPVDPEYPPDRQAFMLDDAAATVLVTHSSLLPRLPERWGYPVPEASNTAHVVCLDTDDPVIASRPDTNPDCVVGPANLAYVIFTSGSTGRPKGVMIEHRGVASLVTWARRTFTDRELEVVLASTSMCFDLSVFEFFAPLSNGGSLYIAADLLEVDWDHARPTLVNTVPSVLAAALAGRTLPDSVITVILAGEALGADLVRAIHASSPPGTTRRVLNCYGPSETTIYSTAADIDATTAAAGLIGIGRPVANTRIYLLDRHLQPVPIGVTGEMYIGGAGVGRGYLNRPELTAERFVRDPFHTGSDARLYRSGDVARYRPDGTIDFLGRVDDQVKIRGFRIEPAEIRAALLAHPDISNAAVITREDTPGQLRVVAYIVGRPGRGTDDSSSAETETEHVARWQTVYDESTDAELDIVDPTFNLAGWISSYTHEPFPPDDVAEWVETTVDRVLALQPKRVMEIGCGTGLLALRIAPHCSTYLGTDLSRPVLDGLERELARQHLPQVRLLHRPATDFEGLEPASFDAVIINSVIQHFPNLDYLLRVLSGAARLVVPGGFIFVGDVLSASYQRTLHTSVELDRASPSVTAAELRQRIDRQIRHEQRLVIDPALFVEVATRWPSLSHASVQVRRGRRRNEMTRFRYDVVLTVGDVSPEAVSVPVLDWQRDQLTIPALRQRLADTEPDHLHLRGIPDARTVDMHMAARLVANAPDAMTVAQLNMALQDSLPGAEALAIEPEDLWSLGADLPYHVELRPSPVADGSVTALLHRNGVPVVESTETEAANGAPGDLARYANDPLGVEFAQTLVPKLRSWLAETMPDYMIPSAFVVVDALPRTPSGKLDRRSLPAPIDRPTGPAQVAPRTGTEQTLAAIWAEVLGIDSVGITDDFFDLGGHSLLAAHMVARTERALGRKLPLALVLQAGTIEALAKMLDQADDAPWRTVFPIRKKGSRLPVFCLHGLAGTVTGYRGIIPYLGDDQPVYGVQCVGLDGEHVPYHRIEEMAAHYVEEVQAVQPRGPYVLVGICFGGLVAFEMAHLLAAKKADVALVAMMDPTPLPTRTLGEQLRRRFKKFRQQGGTARLFFLGETLSLTVEMANMRVWEAVVQRRARQGRPVPRRASAMEAVNARATEVYVPPTYDGRVVVYRSEGLRTHHDENRALAWDTLVGDNVEVVDVPGTSHNSLFLEPHVRIVASHLRDSIERSRAPHQARVENSTTVTRS